MYQIDYSNPENDPRITGIIPNHEDQWHSAQEYSDYDCFQDPDFMCAWFHPWKYHTQNSKKNGLTPTLFQECDKDLASKVIKVKKSERWKGLFVTINPPDDFTESVKKDPKILEAAIKLLTKKYSWMKKLTLTVEQRSDSIGAVEDVRGLHFHISYEQNKMYKKSQYQKDYGDRFLHQVAYKIFCFKNIIWSKTICIEPIRKSDDLTKILDYMGGKKADPRKLEKTLADRTMRNLFNLLEFYKSE